jgi:3-hydroxybutyrate dehydrogenase
MRLKGRSALITGAAGGIGMEIALVFAREGAQVAIADIAPESATVTAALINEKGGQAIGVPMDVTLEQSVTQGVAATIGAFGGVDILVSNAGVQIVRAIEELSFAEWRDVLAVHLDGAFLTTKACLPTMKASGRGGTIIYMGSVHSKVASPLKAPYVTAKHGLLGLAKVVAKEGAPFGVRANVICPGFVRTALVDKQIPEQALALGISAGEVIRDVMLRETVDGEFTSREDVAEVALWLASFPSNALTGQSIVVSHGWHMQ